MAVLELDLSPEAEDRIVRRIVEELLREISFDGPGWMDSRRAADYLGISVDALHKHTAARSVPFHQDGPGCRLWFRRGELDAWRVGGGG